MSQLLEIEFKNMLTPSEYLKLLNYFNVKDDSIKKQTNVYFDTKNMRLKEEQCALRVRIKNNQYELTLKQPDTVGLIETTDLISNEEFKSLLNSHIIPQKEVYTQLIRLNITEDLYEIASLTTFRFEFNYLGQIIAIDRSNYYDFTDYEIELETEDYHTGKEIFNHILSTNSIPLRSSENKIARVMNYKTKHHL